MYGFFYWMGKEKSMKILKVINNNTVSSLDEKNRETVIMGKGIGFRKKPGMEVDRSNIEKIFRMDTLVETKRLADLLNEVPMETVQLVNKIVSYAKKQMKDTLQASIYITLIDHINFALQRQEKNIQFQNPLLYDVKRLYKEEFKISMEAVGYINQTLNTDFTEDEAAAIALHFINARLGEEMPETIHITKIVQSSLKIIQYYFNVEIEDDTIDAEYFISQIKFLAQRVVSKKQLPPMNPQIEQLIREKHQKFYNCAKRIDEYILQEYEIKLTEGELTELTIQIERIINK